MIAKSKETGTVIRWEQLVDSFTNSYASKTKQTEISNRLEALKIDDVREDNDDGYAALDLHTKTINQLAPMTKIKDRDDKAKVRF